MKILSSKFVALLLLINTLISADKGIAAQDRQRSLSQRAISEALTKYEGRPIHIVETTYETRNGHRVACGIFTHENAKEKMAYLFGWIDGGLAMKWGPDWNAATLCLIHHYHAPLP